MATNLDIYKGLTERDIAQLEWSDIVNGIMETIHEDLPEKVVRAIELLVSNWPISEVARQINVSTRTIKNWIAKYPIIPNLMHNSRVALTQWRLARMEQQLGLALDVSEEVLRAEYRPLKNEDGTFVLDDKGRPLMVEPNAKLLGVKAQHARYIMGLFLGDGSKGNLNVNINFNGEEDKVLKAKQDALQYIIDELDKTRGEPVEAEFSIVPEKKNSQPMVNENGEPFFGKMGTLDLTKEGYLCHICGERVPNLAVHSKSKHDLDAKIYEIEFDLEDGALG